MYRVESSSTFVMRFGLTLLTCFSSALHLEYVAAQTLQVVESDDRLVIRDDAQDIFTYNKVSPSAPSGIDSIYERSGCLHPIQTPGGRTVTQMFPVDHPHQQGVFSAWVKTTYDGKEVDFWNLAGRTGLVMHERVIGTFETDEAVGFEVDLIHRATVGRPVDVLRERWKVTAFPTDGSYHVFDLETTQRALTDKPLTIAQHRYGGMVVRGPTRWLTSNDRWAVEHPDMALEPSRFMNSLGSDRVEGNHQNAKWVALTGHLDGEPATIVVLCHADNFRAPQAARLHPSKPYFCFSPCVDGTFTIDREHPYVARYRYLITDTEPDSNWIDEQWNEWCGE